MLVSIRFLPVFRPKHKRPVSVVYYLRNHRSCFYFRRNTFINFGINVSAILCVCVCRWNTFFSESIWKLFLKGIYCLSDCQVMKNNPDVHLGNLGNLHKWKYSFDKFLPLTLPELKTSSILMMAQAKWTKGLPEVKFTCQAWWGLLWARLDLFLPDWRGME